MIELATYDWEAKKFDAAAKGDLKRLKQVHRAYPPWGRIIEYLDDTPDDDYTLVLVSTVAARGGHFECLRFAHENDAYIDDHTCIWAARGGSVECLEYAREHVGREWVPYLEGVYGGSIDEAICFEAARYGQLDCLRYMHEIMGSRLNFDDSMLCEAAMYDGHFECLKYVHENGSPVTLTDCLLLIECLHKGPPFDDPMKCLRYVLKYEASVIEWDMSIGVYPWLVDAYVGNMVDDIFCRVVDSLERERAAVVIQRRWLNHIYSPGARSTAMKRLADDFASLVR